MPQTAIFGPFFATIFLTAVVWVYMYVRRIRFITANQFSGAEMAIPGRLAELSPPAVSNPSDNLKNLFEIPVLFYAIALYLVVANQVDAAHVVSAWIFAGFRALHSAVHCTVNVIMLRFVLYFVSCLALFTMIARAAIRHFTG